MRVAFCAGLCITKLKQKMSDARKQKPAAVDVYLLSRVDIVIRDIEVDFTFRLPEYVRYIEEFVKSRFAISRFYSIHFTVTLPGTKNIVRYIEDFVK